MTKVERNNLIKEIYEKELLVELYKEIIEEEKEKLISAGEVKLKQKILVQDEEGNETWTAIAYQDGGTVFLLDKQYSVDSTFGDDNNYNNSNARTIGTTCKPVLRLLQKYGTDAFVPLEIDLFSHDGLRDYRVCKGDLTGIMTYDMYRNNRENIEANRMWLSTPNSTPSGSDSSYVRYVRSGGGVSCSDCDWSDGGVRPFCVLKSSIFVSCEESGE